MKMSRYHVIDASEGGSYADVRHREQRFPVAAQTTTSMASPRSQSDRYSTGKGEPSLSDMDMQRGMIFGMNSSTGPKVNYENLHFDEKVRLRLKFLEDSNTVMQTRNQNLLTENRAIHSQVVDRVRTVIELKNKLQEAREELEKERNTSKKPVGTNSKEQMCSTDGLTTTAERSSQCWAVCLACQRILEGHEAASEPTVTITKTELESLESDMQALRDAIVVREESWDKAMKREENYRQQLVRLSTETVTARHLTESRHNELHNLAISLAEKEEELKATQKDLLSLRKIVVKLELRQRELEENFDPGNAEANLNLTPMSEREQKTVEELMRRQFLVRPKQKPRPKGWSSSPQSLQTTPRSARTRETNVAM